MHRLFGRPPLLFAPQRPVATLGMFDGVHLGHRAVLGETVDWARELQAPAVAVTFDVHPRTLLAPREVPDTITSLEHRLQHFEALGIDTACVLPFTPELAHLSAGDFVQAYLVDWLHVQAVALGHTGRFGKDQRGDIHFLRDLGQRHGFATREVAGVIACGQPVSSTAIRDAVRAGELDCAAEMLGRPVSVLGTVVPGEGIGRSLGFPTLNLDPHHELIPPQGVYVTRVCWGENAWQAVTNIGHRPTVDASGPRDLLVEAHLLDWSGDLYGQHVEALFLQRLRAEKKFDSREALSAQIAADTEAARAWFAARA